MHAHFKKNLNWGHEHLTDLDHYQNATSRAASLHRLGKKFKFESIPQFMTHDSLVVWKRSARASCSWVAALSLNGNVTAQSWALKKKTLSLLARIQLMACMLGKWRNLLCWRSTAWHTTTTTKCHSGVQMSRDTRGGCVHVLPRALNCMALDLASCYFLPFLHFLFSLSWGTSAQSSRGRHRVTFIAERDCQ